MRGRDYLGHVFLLAVLRLDQASGVMARRDRQGVGGQHRIGHLPCGADSLTSISSLCAQSTTARGSYSAYVIFLVRLAVNVIATVLAGVNVRVCRSSETSRLRVT